MPVQEITPTIKHYGDGSTVLFTFPFQFLDEGDIDVYIDGVLVDTSEYSVTSPGIGGDIEFVSAPNDAALVEIRRSVDLLRSTDFAEMARFAADDMDDELDRIVMMVQEINEDILKYNPTEIAFDAEQTKIRNVATPSTYYDAATKGYVDLQVDTYINQALGASERRVAVIATGGQTVFTLSQSYVPGKNNISVWVNGVRQPSSAYTETDSTTVTLSESVEAGDTVEFIIGQIVTTVSIEDAANVLYTPSGVGAVARTVKNKLDEIISVKDFGAVGDGVTDDTAAIQAAFDAVDINGTVRFGVGETYLISDTLTAGRPSKIDLRGSRIVTTSAVVDKIAIYAAEQLDYVTGFTPFAATKGQSAITVDSSVVVAVGDVIEFRSSDVRVAVTGNDYYHGMFAIVLEASGSDLVLDRAFYDTFNVDEVYVWRGHPGGVEICNGEVDISSTPAGVSSNTGITVRTNNIFVHNMRFVGNQYAGIGLHVSGVNAVVENCTASNILCIYGLPGGGRTGYGVDVSASNTVVRDCNFHNCKHHVVSGSRTNVVENITYERCTCVNDATFVSSTYDACIDFHSNVIGELVVRDCNVLGHYKLINIRAPGIKILGGVYEQHTGSSGVVIGGYEMGFYDLVIEGATLNSPDADGVLLYITTTTPTDVDTVSNVSIRNCKFNNGSIVFIDRTTAINGIYVEGNTFTGEDVVILENTNAENVVIQNNECLSVNRFFRWVADHTFTFNHLSIVGNRVGKDGTNNNSVISVYADDSTKFALSKFWAIDNNTLDLSANTGTGYGISLTLIAVENFSMSGNVIDRGTFRCIGVNSVDLTNAKILNNIVDDQISFFDNLAAGNLTALTVLGNTGNTYVVNTGSFGYTKTQYLCTSTTNNFNTFTP